MCKRRLSFSKYTRPAQTLLLFAIICFADSLGIAQIRSGNNAIKGKVTSSETGEALIGAIVFLNNTTIGTSTKNDGSFLIDNIPSGEYDVVFSLVGFERQSRHLSTYGTATTEMDAALKPKPVSVTTQEVIGGDASEWKKLLQVFLENFFGSDENAKGCKVLNPEVINFSVDTSANELVASSDSTIVIDNRSLGYKLSVQIEVFRCELKKKGRITLHAYVKFEELKPQSKPDTLAWANRRRDAYLGSLRHFLKCLFEKRLEKGKFQLSKGGTLKNLVRGHGRRLPEDSLHLEYMRKGVYCQFTVDEPIRVDYNEPRGAYILQMSPETCFFSLRSGSIIINQNGDVISPLGLVVYGRWYDMRIADLLPLDYISDQ
jgi:hypothetical protein